MSPFSIIDFLYTVVMNIKDTKILVLPYTHTLSHLSRPLEIAKHLSEHGCRIIFAGQSEKTKFIREEGFQVEDLFEPDPDTLYGNIRENKIRFIEDRIVNEMVEDDIRLFNKVKPNVILSDGRFSVMVSAQKSKIQHISIVNASSTAYRAIPYVPLIKNIDLDTYPFQKTFNRLVARFNLKIEMRIFNIFMNSFSRLTRKHNLSIPVTATNCLCGVDLTLLADIPDFFPTENMPETYRYIGPITWKSNPTQAFPKWWPIDKHKKKLIYLTMGTTGEEDLFSKVYNAVKKSDMLCIITTGSQSDKIKSVPGKIYVTDYMDGDAVMEIADIVICHGGNGTIYQALSHGVPVIGIPTIPDQEFNMRRLEALGAGIKISMADALSKPELLLQSIQKFEDAPEFYAAPISELKKQLRQINGAQKGAMLIREFIETKL
ncbi:glycosyltransferase [Desulfobacter postgatei]|jgi:MGT family glycosyltransferase|uniref:glycosyltransferase n=1 Tax=Desulfobacter postgatei TaxID=2293 RepID=UPI002A35A43F|nr:glycosyltransferase [Desulfobacter postgatei]MDX9962627.1 glycosyltransferase [Desulfobacter postgatei]